MALRSLDLMSGDYLSYNGQIIKVASITKKKVGYHIKENECRMHYARLSDLRPIPLTPEILEKNGFEDIGDDTYQLEEKPCWFWVDFFKHTYGCEYDTSTYEYEDDEHRLKLYGIPSVHQLQHALRLCGIEKEIEL